MDRARNRDTAIQMLSDRNVEYSVHNDGAHIVIHRPVRIDFWPGPGLWISGVTRENGIDKLLLFIEQR